jgi:excisionase family DNA binding protein
LLAFASVGGNFCGNCGSQRKEIGRKMPIKEGLRKTFAANGKGAEISPEEAATLLGLSTRAIRYLIEEKKLQATKVSGRWFIDQASVLAHKERGQSQKPDAPRARSSVPTGPRALAPYRLCLHAFELMSDTSGHDAVDQRVSQLKLQVLEQLGAGYYSYGDTKKQQYIEARASIGSILGLLYPLREQFASMSKTLSFLEEECIPAIASLLRKLEHKKGGPAPHAKPASLQ